MGFYKRSISRLKERMEKLKLVDFWMYIYISSNTSNTGIDFARPDENTSCANGLLHECLAMTSYEAQIVWYFNRERSSEETALRT